MMRLSKGSFLAAICRIKGTLSGNTLPRIDGCGRLRAADARAAQRQRVYAALHIVGEIAAVGAGVGDQLVLFVQALGNAQRFLSGIAKAAVALPLELGQVKQQRPVLAFAAGIQPGDRAVHAGQLFLQAKGLFFLFQAVYITAVP